MIWLAITLVIATAAVSLAVIRGGHGPAWWLETKILLRACLRKEGLAFIALMVSLTGAGILSAFLFGNLLYFRQQKSTDELFYLSCGMLAIIAITFLSSHRLLGSKLAIEAEVLSMKVKLNQGGDDAA